MAAVHRLSRSEILLARPLHTQKYSRLCSYWSSRAIERSPGLQRCRPLKLCRCAMRAVGATAWLRWGSFVQPSEEVGALPGQVCWSSAGGGRASGRVEDEVVIDHRARVAVGGDSRIVDRWRVPTGRGGQACAVSRRVLTRLFRV